ncbi:MAG: flagellar basal-body rod protein FlgG [Telluria sp.]
MNDSIYIAATGMQAQQLTIDTIANNLANVNTAGFKKGRVSFQEMMQPGAAAGAGAPAPALGLGLAVAGVARDFTPGAVTPTGSPMDLAIDGAGFLAVELADGTRGYARGGTLAVNADGFLATAAGNVLKPGIHIPPGAGAVHIGADGKVTVQAVPNGPETEVGQLELAGFANPGALTDLGGGLYAPTAESGEANVARPGQAGVGKLVQGALEGSNVTLVDEMVTLMVAQRAYEMSSKVIQASDELMSLTNNLRRGG